MKNGDDDKDVQERQRLYERTRDELAASSRSHAESYDRSLLTLSSAFLGGSLAFIGQIIDLPSASWRLLLYGSWVFFALTILLTLYSLLFGLVTTATLTKAAKRYYIDGDEDAWQISERNQRAMHRQIVAYGVTFSFGIVCLAVFVAINLFGDAAMKKVGDPHVEVERGIPTAPFQEIMQPKQPPVTPPAPAPEPPNTTTKTPLPTDSSK